MAGKSTGGLYCWAWRSGDLRIYAASTERGAFRVGLSLEDQGDPCRYFEQRASSAFLRKSEAKNRALILAVKAALDNRAAPPEIPMDIQGTPFQWKAWRAIAKIPYAQTRTYGEVAAMIGKPGAARAVGRAMGQNPLPLIFPCHRVVGVAGLGGFTGGVEIKQYLLGWEKREQ